MPDGGPPAENDFCHVNPSSAECQTPVDVAAHASCPPGKYCSAETSPNPATITLDHDSPPSVLRRIVSVQPMCAVIPVPEADEKASTPTFALPVDEYRQGPLGPEDDLYTLSDPGPEPRVPNHIAFPILNAEVLEIRAPGARTRPVIDCAQLRPRS